MALTYHLPAIQHHPNLYPIVPNNVQPNNLHFSQSWATWRNPRLDIQTPPRSDSTAVRPIKTHQHTVLPPISDFDRPAPEYTRESEPQNASRHSYIDFEPVPPLTDSVARTSPPLPAPSQYDAYQEPITPQSASPSPSPKPEDFSEWFNEKSHMSAQFLAEKTCEMICYLWFSKFTPPTSSSSHNTSPSSPFIPHPNSKTALLQFSVSSVFVHFMQKLLETTQVSQSVIVLALHYIYRLKERNNTSVPHAGSEFRVAVAGLMMANKFVDE